VVLLLARLLTDSAEQLSEFGQLAAHLSPGTMRSRLA
jgi:hypothetical protein